MVGGRSASVGIHGLTARKVLKGTILRSIRLTQCPGRWASSWRHRRGLVALLVIATMLSAAACGAGDSGPRTTDVSDVAEHQTLTVGVATLQQQYADPVLANQGGNTYPVKWLVGEGLLRQDLDAQWIPALATDWHLAEDELTWTFSLRPGVKMHDGSDFTAADVKTSADRVVADTTSFSSYATWASKIDTVEVIDPLTVVIKTKVPYATLPQDTPPPIATEYYQRVGEEAFRAAPVAAGPFRFVSQKFNDSMTFESFTDFWDSDRIANFTSLNLKILPEESSRVAGLQVGQIDMAQGITPNSATQLEGQPQVGLARVDQASTANIFFTDLYFPEDSLLKDQRVREALLLAIDREAIANALYRGFGAVPANVTFPTTPGNNAELTPHPYDPDRARELLAEAGASELTFDLHLYNQTTAIADVVKFAEAVVDYWKQVGVTVNLDVSDPATYLDRVISHQYRGAVILGVPALLLVNPSNLTNYYAATGAYSSVNDPALEQMFADMSAATDLAERDAVAGDISTYLYDTLYGLPVVSLDAVYGLGTNVTRFDVMEGNPYAGPFWYLRAR